MINKALVVQKLREIRDNMLEKKQKGVGFSDSAEFSSWRDTVTRWLKLGLPHTQDELKKFQYHLYFTVPRAQISDEDCYDYEDQSAYEKACDQTISLLGFAIENIEMGLI